MTDTLPTVRRLSRTKGMSLLASVHSGGGGSMGASRGAGDCGHNVVWGSRRRCGTFGAWQEAVAGAGEEGMARSGAWRIGAILGAGAMGWLTCAAASAAVGSAQRRARWGSLVDLIPPLLSAWHTTSTSASWCITSKGPHSALVSCDSDDEALIPLCFHVPHPFPVSLFALILTRRLVADALLGMLNIGLILQILSTYFSSLPAGGRLSLADALLVKLNTDLHFFIIPCLFKAHSPITSHRGKNKYRRERWMLPFWNWQGG
jgi:hypothetical protein